MDGRLLRISVGLLPLARTNTGSSSPSTPRTWMERLALLHRGSSVRISVIADAVSPNRFTVNRATHASESDTGVLTVSTAS